jgi:glycosyltransferase involved in cell wall biosynthesis
VVSRVLIDWLLAMVAAVRRADRVVSSRALPLTELARPAISLVLPAYNEADNIERAVREAAAAGARAGSYEVVVVDDGSKDATHGRLAPVQAELGARLRVVRHERNRGYGAALRSGFAAAEGELVFYTDADNQFDLSELAGFLPLMREWDAVLGYRIARKDARLRRWTSWVFNRLSCTVFGLEVRDLNCSFKLFRRDVLGALPLASDDFFIDTEIVVRLHRGGFRYVERGVTHLPRTAGRSTVRPSDVPRTLAAIARMRSRLASERGR